MADSFAKTQSFAFSPRHFFFFGFNHDAPLTPPHAPSTARYAPHKAASTTMAICHVHHDHPQACHEHAEEMTGNEHTVE